MSVVFAGEDSEEDSEGVGQEEMEILTQLNNDDNKLVGKDQDVSNEKNGENVKSALDILKVNNLDHTKRIKDFTEDEISKIRKSIDESYTVEGDLRRNVSQNIKRLKDLGCYRGLRHRRQLPTRGQRTHTNARTRKGKAVAIAGKKKVTK